MGNQLHTLDYVVFLTYFVIVSGYGYWIYQRKKSAVTSANDFFLAEGALTWWAIGASLIASNISAEQFIGMSGSGFAMGLAIASYEWMAAATLIVVAIFFMPGYISNKIFTMPQFLEKRFSPLVATMMAVFWLLVYVFVNLTSILYLGAIAVSTISGFSFTACALFLAVFAIIITLGGMKVIGYTDVIQVAILVLGGLATTYLALNLVADQFGGGGMWAGLAQLRQQAPEHFHMIFDESNPYYKDLPGMTVLIGAMWIANLNYWGCNQYITQRALGAKIETARSGLLFASFLKLLMPIIVVLPGIAAYVLHQRGMFQAEMVNAAGELKPDRAYPVLLNLLGPGLKGLSFAALTAAIVASLAGKANSIATIFTLDIYQKFFLKKPVPTGTTALDVDLVNASPDESNLVRIGRWAIIVSMLIAILVAPQLQRLEQGFQFIQDFTGLISPGVVAIFLLGFFWKRATANAALVAALLTIPMGLGIKTLMPDVPFLDRMGWVFLVLVGIMAAISLADPKSKNNPKAMSIDPAQFRTSQGFAIGAMLIIGVLGALYIVFW
ncbi:MAG: sodium/sugar symporter [Saprospiraceae bacterium]|nr:sodium/sugar symporter [Saprospiraceae bacterium]